MHGSSWTNNNGWVSWGRQGGRRAGMASSCHCALVPSLVSERNPWVADKWVAGINIHNFYCCAEKYFITAVWYAGEVFLQLLGLPISSCLLQNLSLDTGSRELVTSGECSHSLHTWLCTAAVSSTLQRIWNKLIQCEFFFFFSPAFRFGNYRVPNFLENWNAARPVWRWGGN